MEIDKYIHHIKSHDTYGNGILIGNYFFTAAHVIEKAVKSYVTIEDKTQELTKDTALVLKTNEERRWDGYDLAIYRFDDIIPSPLTLYDKLPTNDIIINCGFYNRKSSIMNKSNVFSSPIEEEYVFTFLNGKAIHIYGNFIECKLNGKVRTGNSGCPIIYGTSVVGILYGDKDEKDSSETALFLSSKAIIRLLDELSIPFNRIYSNSF